MLLIELQEDALPVAQSTASKCAKSAMNTSNFLQPLNYVNCEKLSTPLVAHNIWFTFH